MMQDGFSKLAVSGLVTLSLAPTTLGGREGASPSSPVLIAGDTHAAAIKKDGTLWAWGLNENGQ
jgi:hypothetical protein